MAQLRPVASSYKQLLRLQAVIAGLSVEFAWFCLPSDFVLVNHAKRSHSERIEVVPVVRLSARGDHFPRVDSGRLKPGQFQTCGPGRRSKWVTKNCSNYPRVSHWPGHQFRLAMFHLTSETGRG